jgi:hypothetical protein
MSLFGLAYTLGAACQADCQGFSLCGWCVCCDLLVCGEGLVRRTRWGRERDDQQPALPCPAEQSEIVEDGPVSAILLLLVSAAHLCSVVGQMEDGWVKPVSKQTGRSGYVVVAVCRR